MKYIIKIQRSSFFTDKPCVNYIATYTTSKPIVTDNIDNAYRFTFEEKECYLQQHELFGTVICLCEEEVEESFINWLESNMDLAHENNRQCLFDLIRLYKKWEETK